jgi:putative transposase
MRRAYVYRLYPGSDQQRELDAMCSTHRRLYNTCLDYRQLAYDLDGATITYADCSRWFTHQRKIDPFYARLNFSSAQATMRRLDKAFQAFFRRVKAGEKPGYPRFKGRDRFHSVEFPAYGDGIRLIGAKLRVQHVGMIKIKIHRAIEGQVKTVTLKREAGNWYAIFSCELPDVPIRPNDRPPVGIDVGLESFLTTSDGDHEPNPRYLKTALPALRRCQRSHARKVKGSRNRQKSKRQLAKIHARVRRLRKEHHHQVALKVVRRYGFIAAERLEIQGMLRSGRLARSIADAGWDGFLRTLQCKAESAGIAYVPVDPRGTSQRCSQCSHVVSKTLWDRWHACPDCGLSLDRDENSAREILRLGLLAWTGPVGRNVGA